MFDGNNPPKMLEYNADTPTALLEASVIQWHWMEDVKLDLPYRIDQFNSIHEKLIEAWTGVLRDYPDATLYFTSVKDNTEDYMTSNYLRDTAIQAGFKTKFIYMEDLRWDHSNRCFVDENATPICMCFKLYPWEWMFENVADPECAFGPDVRLDRTMWFEPAWKTLLSNKAILPLLWQLFPNHPNLLRAEWEPFGDSYAKKPILSREGANISLVLNNQVLTETDGEYAYSPYVYQELALLPDFNRNFPVIGSWMVNGYACGIGIREDQKLVTGNTSRFVPHLFRK
jgi:glutathionylspermidine synthase